MKKGLLLLCLVFTTIITIAQSTPPESIDTTTDNTWIKRKIIALNEELIKTTNDSIKIRLFHDIDYNYYLLKKDDSSLFYSYKAYELSKKIKNVPLTLNSIDYLIQTQKHIGNFAEAIKLVFEGIELGKKNNDTTGILYFSSSIVDIYRTAKDYKNQLLYAIKSRQVASQYSNNEQAKGIIDDYATIGDAYQNNGNLDSALYYFNKDYEITLKDTTHSLSLALTNLGEINLRLKNYDIALIFFKNAINKYPEELKKGLIYESLIIEMLSELSKVYQATGKIDSALVYSKKSYRLAKAQNSNSEISTTSELLYKQFEAIKNYDSAFFYQNVYIKLKDSLYNDEKTRTLSLTSIEESIKQAKMEEELALQKEERNKNIVLAAIGVFIPIFISIIFAIGRFGKKKPKYITSLGIAALLMFFEFISLIIHPYIVKYTHHNVILMYIILLTIASGLVPLHHKLEKFVKNKLSEES